MRGDYKELIDLSIFYLEGKPDDTFRFKSAGPIHKARWMGKLLYCIKLNLCENKIREQHEACPIYSDIEQTTKIEHFVYFIIMIYIPWWFQCSMTADSPINDLCLLKDINEFSGFDEAIAQKALKSFSNHTWYLTEELIPLALFSKRVPSETKQELVSQLLQHPNECSNPTTRKMHTKTTKYGKPNFPVIKNISNASLKDFIGIDSWYFFKILKIDTAFLTLPVDEWDENECFKGACKLINNIHVVNDSAERGVKLASDFLCRAQLEQRYQHLLQVVENDRSLLQNQRIRGHSNRETWFLHM